MNNIYQKSDENDELLSVVWNEKLSVSLNERCFILLLRVTRERESELLRRIKSVAFSFKLQKTIIFICWRFVVVWWRRRRRMRGNDHMLRNEIFRFFHFEWINWLPLVMFSASIHNKRFFFLLFNFLTWNWEISSEEEEFIWICSPLLNNQLSWFSS